MFSEKARASQRPKPNEHAPHHHHPQSAGAQAAQAQAAQAQAQTGVNVRGAGQAHFEVQRSPTMYIRDNQMLDHMIFNDAHEESDEQGDYHRGYQ